ncbi:arrestin domain-containing protein 3-like [Sitodiplosis mosellana]|uniref:arrestin domain-containing protein 3-like n=1 Tax=Sitodiplosis mosellana TaxID=263140 RepID=UPI00244382DF|nr:arrestin domain-containing protein 3-like [Sitodiplosis mosellana]
MATTCKIEFENNPRKVVYAGQLLKGTVRLHLTKAKRVRSLYIRIHGRAYVHWVDGTSDNRKVRVFTGNEDYFSERTNFVGGYTGEVRLSPGTYSYTFQCLLPPNLPTSLETEYGYIRYTARVVLDVPTWSDKSFAVPFTVIKMVDLNNFPRLRQPVEVEKNDTFFICCILCCCSSRPMQIVARVPVGGYTPGQFINLEINVNNHSGQSISGFNIHLIKRIKFFIHADSVRQKHLTYVLAKQYVDYSNEEVTTRVDIRLPSVPPTDLSASNIIKFGYSIRITACVSCCYNDPVLEVPITIGTYPLQDNVPPLNVPTLHPHSIQVNAVADPITPLLPSNNVVLQQPTNRTNYSTLSYPSTSNAPLSYPDSEDPPTYEEAMQLSEAADNEFRPVYPCEEAMQLSEAADNEFRPVYPVFKRSTSYSSGNSIH